MGHGFGICGFGTMGGASLMMILFLVVVGFLFYLILKKPAANQKDANNFTHPAVEADPLNILKSRLASGEITIQEFEQIKKTIS
jgi:putative membrane protein